MADKIIIGEVDLDISKATKEAQALKESIDLLNDELKKAQEAGGKTSKEYIELESALKVTKKEYNSQVQIIGKSIQADTAKAGSLDEQSAKLAVVTKKWRALSEDERLNTEEGRNLTKQKTELTKSLKGEEEATGDARRSVGGYSEGIKNAAGSLTGMVPVLGQATAGAKLFGTAFKFALGPILLIIAAGAALVNFFKSSEEGQNKLAKVTAIFSTVLGNLSDIVSKVGGLIFDAFTKPQETVEKLKDRVKEIGDFFKNTFGNIIGGAIDGFVARLLKGFAGVGLAWQKLKGVFTDNSEDINKAQEKIEGLNERIEESNERIKKGSESLGDSIKKGWDKAKEGLTGFIEEQEREISIAKKLADQQAELDKQIRVNLVQEAKDRLELEQLKNSIDDKATNTAEERLKLIDRENELLDQIQERNLNIAQQKLEIQQAQNALSNSTKEDLQAEAELQAEIFNIEATITAARKEAIAKRIEAENQIRTELEATAARSLEILKEKLEAERELLDEERQRKLDQEQLDFENDFAINEGNLFAILELKRKALEAEQRQEVEFAKAIGADVDKVNKKYAKAQRALDIAEFNAKLSLTAGFTQNLATIFGEQTAIGKAAAIANATVSTIQGAISSYTSLSGIPVVGPVLGAVAAGAALAAGYAQVKEILSVKSGLPGEGSVSASVPSSGGSGFSAAAISAPTSTAPQIGSGIISRSAQDSSSELIAAGMGEAIKENPLQPTLITDEVTVDQDQNLSRNKTATT